MLKIGILCVLATVWLQLPSGGDAVCCRRHSVEVPDLAGTTHNVNLCDDCSVGTPYCSRTGSCNMFGCNCDGGCRYGRCSGSTISALAPSADLDQAAQQMGSMMTGMQGMMSNTMKKDDSNVGPVSGPTDLDQAAQQMGNLMGSMMTGMQGMMSKAKDLTKDDPNVKTSHSTHLSSSFGDMNQDDDWPGSSGTFGRNRNDDDRTSSFGGSRFGSSSFGSSGFGRNRNDGPNKHMMQMMNGGGNYVGGFKRGVVRIETAHDVIRAADKDMDGMMSLGEAHAHLASEGFPADRLARSLAALDVDKDNFLTAHEID